MFGAVCGMLIFDQGFRYTKVKTFAVACMVIPSNTIGSIATWLHIGKCVRSKVLLVLRVVCCCSRFQRPVARGLIYTLPQKTDPDIAPWLQGRTVPG